MIRNYAQGSFFIPASQKAKNILQKASADLNLNVINVSKRPANLSGKLSPLRIALWDMYGGSISSGWLRWIMEQHHFNFKTIYAKEINAGNLKKKYDVIIFVSGAIPCFIIIRTTIFKGYYKIKGYSCRIQVSMGKNQCRYIHC